MPHLRMQDLPPGWTRRTDRPRNRLVSVEVLPTRLHSGLNAGVAPPPNLGMRDRAQLVYDAEKELSRKQRRTVFEFYDWGLHRSPARFLLSISTLPKSHILRSLTAPIAWVACIATVICANHTLVNQGVLSDRYEVGAFDLAPLSVTAAILPLLLVFRTTEAFTRYDEGRRMCELMHNRCRDLARQASAFFPQDSVDSSSLNGAQIYARMNTSIRESFARWVVVYMTTTISHVRPGEDLAGDVRELLPEEELEMLLQSDHKVLLCIQVMSQLIEAAQVSTIKKSQMHDNLQNFADLLAVERLLRTPIPVSYTHHTTRFLVVWLSILPFGLWGEIGWASVPAVCMIALCLLGIDEIGIELEDPFGLLPMEVYAHEVKMEVFEIMNREQDVRQVSFSSGSDAQEEVNSTIFEKARLPQRV